MRWTKIRAICSSSTSRMDWLVLTELADVFGRTNPVKSGRTATFCFVPPACSVSSAATFSARSMLTRSMARYFSEVSLFSPEVCINELVPEMICNKLLSSLVPWRQDSADGFCDSDSVGELIHDFLRSGDW